MIKRGAYPTTRIGVENLDYLFYKYAKDHQIEHVSPFIKFIVEKVDVQIAILAQTNTRRLSTVDPEKQARAVRANKEISDIFREREKKGEIRGAIAPFPTNAMAQEAELSLIEYEDFIFSACLVDFEDPMAEWKKISEKQKKIVEFLNTKREIRYVGKDTDLRFKIKGRRWINADGKHNLPDGEVFTGPIEDSAEGKIRFTYPGIYAGKEVEDIYLEFKGGKVVNAEAKKGEELLHQMLKVDEGASRVGEIAIGTNSGVNRFTKNMLFDEKMGGTIHIALGNSIPETGGENKSSIHWDVLKDMKEGGKIYADGELFYKDGKFLK